jgi:UDP-N-acetylmuramate dehydrogenase
MPLPASTLDALRHAGLPVQPGLSLAPRLYWRVGGPAAALVDVARLEELVAVQRVAAETGAEVLVIGKGSNLLVADAGVDGIVVRLTGALASARAVQASPLRVEAGAGTALVALLSQARRERWPGFACFAGIPGTVGGAVRMNAGSTLGETAGVLEAVTVVHRGGAVETLPAADLGLAYRTCHLPEGAIVASAVLRGLEVDPEAEQERIVAFLKHRKATQPLDQPSCGSTFRNPPGDHAGRLIEAAGLKGMRVGGAEVSEKHANFIVNTGEATAADLRAAIERVQHVVAERFGVALETEVVLAGDWGGWKTG